MVLYGDNANLVNNGIITQNLPDIDPDHSLQFISILGQGSQHTITNTGTIDNQTGHPETIRMNGDVKSLTINNSGTISAASAIYPLIQQDPTVGDSVLYVNNAASGILQSATSSVIKSYATTGGSTNIRNSGIIETGVSGGTAISLGNANDSLTLESTSNIVGIVDGGGGTNTLALAGSSNGSFDISQVGASQQYRNFTVFQKNEASTWTLTGDNSATQAQNWQLNEGGLIVAGNLTGGVTQTNSSGSVSLAVNGGSISADPDDATHTAIAMTGSGDATVTLDTTAGNVSVSGAIVAANGGHKTLTLTGTQNGTLNQDGLVVGGFDSFTKTGSGNWTLSGANNGDAAWDLQAGTLTLDNDRSLGTGQLTMDGGALAIDGDVNFANAVNLAVDSTIDVGSGEQSALSGTLSGAGALTKTGAGTLNIAGDGSGHTGAITVSGGTLAVDGTLNGSSATIGADGTVNLLTGTLSSTGPVTVSGTLKGEGTVNGDVTVASGGSLKPGDHGVLGAMSINGNLTMQTGSTLDYDIDVPGSGPEMPGQSDALHVNGNVSLHGNLNVNPDAAGGVGYYTVLDYSGTLDTSGLTVSDASGQYGAGAFQVNTSTPGRVDLIVGGGDASVYYWNGSTTTAGTSVQGGSGTWDATTTNWTDQGGDTPRTGPDSGSAGASNMLFQGTAGTVDVEGDHQFGSLQFATDGYVLNGGGTLNVAQGNDNEVRVLDQVTATIDTTVTGNGNLDKTGGGTLVLNGSNSYTGGTTFSEGTVQVAADANLGAASGDLTFAGGALENTASMTSARDVHFNTGGGALNVDASTTLTLSGTLDGAGGMVKQGEGTLVLSGDNNSYAGGSLLQAGVTEISGDNNLGTGEVALDGGVLHSTADVTLANKVLLGDAAGDGGFDVDGDTTLRLNGDVNGPGTLVKDGDGTLVLAGDSDYAGGTALDAGTIRIESSHGAGIGTIEANGGTLDLADGVKVGNDIALNTDLSINVDPSDATATEYGKISGEGALSKTGDGTLVLVGDNSYSGPTNLDGGTLKVGGDSALGTGVINGNGGTLSYLDGAVVKNDLVVNDSTTLDVSAADATATQAGGVSGEGGITKTGDGTLVMTGDNSYTGATEVKGGTLQMDGDAKNSTFTVDNGASLTGDGTLGGLSTHGAISPGGDDAVGTMNIAGNLTMYGDATYNVTAGPDGSADLIAVGGTADIQGASLVVTAQSGEYKPNTAYTIITAGGGLTGQFGDTSVNLPFLDPSVQYGANSATLTLRRNDIPFDSIGNSPNERNVGKGLDQMQKNVGSNALLDAVADLTAPDVPHAYQQLSAESYASLQNAAQTSSQAFVSSVWDRLGSPLAGEVENGASANGDGRNLWVSLPFAQQHVDGNNGTSGYDSQIWGFNLGADTAVGQNLRVGVAAGYLSTEQSNDTLGTDGTVNTGNLSLYGQYDTGNWWLGGMAGVGAGQLSNHRSVSFPGYSATADGSAPVRSLFAKLGGGYRIKTAVGTIEPMASVDVVNTRVGTLTESGNSDINLNMSGTDQTSVASEVGARFSRGFQLDSGTSGAFSASLSWRHQLVTPNSTVNAGFVTGSTDLLTYQGTQLPSDSAVVGLALKVNLSKRSALSFGYQGEFGSGQTTNAVVGQYQYHW